MRILNQYYFPLDVELVPCIPGLVMSLLPGLDEQNEELQKNVLDALKTASECVGLKYLLGSIWMVPDSKFKSFLSELASRRSSAPPRTGTQA